MGTSQKTDQQLLYTALGDSLTVGVGSTLFAPGFVGRYLCFAENALKQPIHLDVFAKVGATTGDVLAGLDLPIVADGVRHAELMTITAGGNDLIDAAEQFLVNSDEKVLLAALEKSMENYSKILEKINKINEACETLYYIKIINLYNPFPQIQEAAKGVKAFNSHLASFSRMNHVKVVDIYPIFEGNQDKLLSHDHIHPNDLGYEKIAEALNNVGYAPLGPN